jgi:hypothetical protein
MYAKYVNANHSIAAWICVAGCLVYTCAHVYSHDTRDGVSAIITYQPNTRVCDEQG